jgi:hypothetical protein
MKLLPPPGRERTRLLLMIAALIVLGLAYAKWGGGPELVIPTSTGPQAAPARQPLPPRAPGPGAPAGSSAAPRVDPSVPQPLKLAEMEQVPEEPAAGRNLFRYGVKPPPPPPPYVAPPPLPPPRPPVPQGPPVIPLKLTAVLPDPYVAGRNRAYLTDPKNGVVFEGIEGAVIDGRYRLIKVTQSSVVISYLDGTGQRTINVGG